MRFFLYNNCMKEGGIVKKTNIITIILLILVLGLSGYIVYDKVLSTKEGNTNYKDNNNKTDGNDNNSLSAICTLDEWDASYLKDLHKKTNKTETGTAMGGGDIQYTAVTTVTKEHNYTSTLENEEKYASDLFDTLYVLYNNKIYYTSEKNIISKYCVTESGSIIKSCDYSKFNDNTIKEFNPININLTFKVIGSYGNAGSGSSYPYAITTDGKVINIPNISSKDYNSCGILYENSEYPIDRIFNMNFYDGVEYTILLKDGTLITRDVSYGK